MQPVAGAPHPAYTQQSKPGFRQVGTVAPVTPPAPGQAYVMPEVSPLTPPPEDLQLIRISRPWKIYRRMLGTVIVTLFIAEFLVFIPYGMAMNEPLLSICGAILAAPFIFLLAFMRRPTLVHLQRAIPDGGGSNLHRLPMGGSLQTPIPTRFSHHIVRDDSLLDIPPSKSAWFLFAGLILTTGFLTALFLSGTVGMVIAVTLFIIIGIPAWLLGFSIPVVAWWSWCTRKIGLVTRQREAESWLVAGMLSAIPALIINSIIFPVGAGIFFSESVVEILMPVVSAPFGEEICKGLFILAFIKSIDSPRRGFQIGFTVGLGFAMLENLIYILSSTLGGPLSFTMNTLIRGVGSIPGHAFWTGLTGTGIGWMMMRKNAGQVTDELDSSADDIYNPVSDVKWTLIDPKSGGIVNADASPVVSPETELLGEFRLPLLEPFTDFTEKNAISTPKHPLTGLALAISGHAFWNGTLTLLELFGTASGFSDSTIIAMSLVWSACLVGGILYLGQLIIRGVLATPKSLSSP